MDIEYRFLSRPEKIDLSEIVNLYKDAGWWEEQYDETFIPGIIESSFCFAGAFYEGHLVGMGRALSDGCSDAYIQDVVVLRSLRGQGIGGRLIQEIIQYLKKNDIDWIGLIGEPGTQAFYERLGFKSMNGYIPMRLTENKM